jgi:hypothetical protein
MSSSKGYLDTPELEAKISGWHVRPIYLGKRQYDDGFILVNQQQKRVTKIGN